MPGLLNANERALLGTRSQEFEVHSSVAWQSWLRAIALDPWLCAAGFHRFYLFGRSGDHDCIFFDLQL